MASSTVDSRQQQQLQNYPAKDGSGSRSRGKARRLLGHVSFSSGALNYFFLCGAFLLDFY